MRWAIRALIVLVPLLSLLLLGRVVADWITVAQVTGVSPAASAPRGFDWVQWEDQDGDIVAAYVYPGGTAHAAGLRQGAVLFQLEYQLFFSADDVKSVVEGVMPGRDLVYDVFEPAADGSRRAVSYDIRITRYPTFLYPLSGTLWRISIWGFTLAAFLHIIGLVIVAPLARRTRRTRRTTLLFAAASLWVVGNLARLLLVTVLGPPSYGFYATAFEALTLVALSGWVLFPALLLNNVVCDVRRFRVAAGGWRLALFLPPLLLGGITAAIILGGPIGPMTLDTLIGPIVFYVSCYVAVATALTATSSWLVPDRQPASEGIPAATAWSRVGSALVCVIAVIAALSVVGVVPLPGTVSDATVGGLIILVQLLSLAPVGLVSVATLRHGRADTVISGALAYLVVAGGVFFLILGGLILIERRLVGAPAWTHALAASFYTLIVLLVVERIVHIVRRKAGGWLLTERQRARERLRRYAERMRFILDADRLAQATVEAVGEALDARSAVLFLRDPGSIDEDDPRWIRASFKPEPPFFTEGELRAIWSRIQRAGTIWSRNAELNESELPDADHRLLNRYGAALAIPVAGGETEPRGLLVLSRKSRRRAVYNLEDVALLRALVGQLALATERLALLEREKALVRQTAEAELTALRAQINPHFLFNSLNTIASLIAEHPADAEKSVERLAKIFRHILTTEGRTFVPLRDEVALVRNYLAIEQARFGEKLAVKEHWDPELMDLPVPAFALQTLVENAVKHGIERQRGGGELSLASRVSRDGGEAVLTVSDTGAGIPELFAPHEGDGAPDSTFYGIGLQNVASRLERLYGRSDLLRLASGPETGTVAQLLIPLAPADAL